MTWWSWIVLGLILFTAEIAVPGGFFLLFFGVGGVLVGLISYFELFTSSTAEWLLFSIFSLTSLALVRPRLLKAFPSRRGVEDADTLVGQRGICDRRFTIDGQGQLNLRGSVWSARNIGQSTIEIGSEFEVVAVEGITLLVRGV